MLTSFGSSQMILPVAEIAGDDYLEILINLYSILDRMLPTHVLKTAGFYLCVPKYTSFYNLPMYRTRSAPTGLVSILKSSQFVRYYHFKMF